MISDQLKKEIFNLRAVNKLVTQKLILKIKNKKIVEISNSKSLNNQFPKKIYDYFGLEKLADKVDKPLISDPILPKAKKDEPMNSSFEKIIQNDPISQPNKNNKAKKKYSIWMIFTILIILLILVSGIFVTKKYNFFV